jgi:nucleotide-binding universal stress UspA family protein
MAIRTILVPVDGSEAARPALDLAFAVGREFLAHVDVLHVRPDPKDAMPLLGEGMSGAMIEEMIELADKEAKERAAAACRLFDETCHRLDVSVTAEPPAADRLSAAFVEIQGREDETVAHRGRLADLIVVARPPAESDKPASLALNAAIFETGRPVLLAPPAVPVRVGRTVAIAWNGSAEAARAVAGGFPFIANAGKVVVLTANGDQTPSGAAEELAAHLAWHGVTAVAETFSPAGHQIGTALLLECGKVGADLLVMGAYTHSRMWQVILGGATSHILAQSSIPVLMTH